MMAAALRAIDGDQLRVDVDDKGKLRLPATPAADDLAGCAAWLTVVFNLDPRHPIRRGAREGPPGPEGHVVLERVKAPDIRFEPASSINSAPRLIETLSWRLLPSDGAVHAFKAEHCRQIAHVVRMFCGAFETLSEKQETAGIVGAFLAQATAVHGRSTYGTGAQRYEAARALQPDSEDGDYGPRYLIDENTGELVIRVGDLRASARTHIGSSLPRGWLDARMVNLGWQRLELDGRAVDGRAGRHSPHARAVIYRGHLPVGEDTQPSPRHHGVPPTE